MRRFGLRRLRRQEPPALTTCLAIAVVLAVPVSILVAAVLPFGDDVKPLLFAVWAVCAVATIVWRFHRYGVNGSEQDIAGTAAYRPLKRQHANPAKAPRRRKAYSYKPKNVYVRVPHQAQYSLHFRRSSLLP